MKNPFFVDSNEPDFQAAAVAVRDLFRANVNRAEIPGAELAKLPEVAAVMVGGKLSGGYREEIENRLRGLVNADIEVEAVAQQAAAVDRRAAELLTSG